MIRECSDRCAQGTMSSRLLKAIYIICVSPKLFAAILYHVCVLWALEGYFISYVCPLGSWGLFYIICVYSRLLRAGSYYICVLSALVGYFTSYACPVGP